MEMEMRTEIDGEGDEYVEMETMAKMGGSDMEMRTNICGDGGGDEDGDGWKRYEDGNEDGWK